MEHPNYDDLIRNRLESQLKRDQEVSSFFFVSFSLVGDMLSPSLDRNVRIFLRDRSSVTLWIEGLFLIEQLFEYRQSMLEPLYGEVPIKFTVHCAWQASNGGSGPSLQLRLVPDNRVVTIQGAVEPLCFKSPDASLVQLDVENATLMELLEAAAEQPISYANSEVEKLKSNIESNLDKIGEEQPLLKEELYQKVLKVALAFSYPTIERTKKAFSVFVFPGYRIGSKEISTGGLVVVWRKELPDDASLGHILLLVQLLASMQTSTQLIRNVERHALRSAVAAIMARNMSHLLGSHIEPGIQNDLISLVRTVSKSQLLKSTGNWPSYVDVEGLIKEVAKKGWPWAFRELTGRHEVLRELYQIQQKALDRYALYRQRRMDFIARVATDWPAWGVGFDFYINFVRPFLANSILLHFVGYSDGVHLDWLDFDVHIADSKVTEQYTPQPNAILKPVDMAVSWGAVESEGRTRYPSRPHNHTPVMVWSRGGDMAVQAFHVILENIIRNSIKHRLKSIKDKGKLRIGIRLFQTYQELSDAVECPEGLRLKASDDLVYVVISSDADCPKEAENLDKKICEPVIKETGEREPENWGMKEIKIAAAFLGNRKLEKANDTKPDFVRICKVKMPKENGQDKQLGYCFTLPRFYYVGILKQGAGDVVPANE